MKGEDEDAPKEVPEPRLGDHLVGREDAHAVDFGVRVLLGGQVATHDLVLHERHSTRRSSARMLLVGTDGRVRLQSRGTAGGNRPIGNLCGIRPSRRQSSASQALPPRISAQTYSVEHSDSIPDGKDTHFGGGRVFLRMRATGSTHGLDRMDC